MTIHANEAGRLVPIHNREARSLLQYVRDASLFAGRDQDALAAILRIAQEAATALEAVASYLDSQRIAPNNPDPFAMEFTDLNFTAVRSVLPKLVDAHQREVATLEREAAAFHDESAKRIVATLLETKRKHLQELEALVAG